MIDDLLWMVLFVGVLAGLFAVGGWVEEFTRLRDIRKDKRG